MDGQGWEGVSYLLQLQPQFPRPETLKLGLPPGLASGESHPWLPAARDLPPSKELMLLSLGFIIPASTDSPVHLRRQCLLGPAPPTDLREQSKKGPLLSRELLAGQRKEQLPLLSLNRGLVGLI